MNALTLLEKDHRKVKQLLARLETTTIRGVKTRTSLFTRLKSELTAHEDVEETIFYPALRNHPRAKQLVLESYEEHDVVDRLIGQLTGLPVQHETWGPKAKVMQENLEHHIEEEEGPLFTNARQVFSRRELADLGQKMADRKRDIQARSR